MAKYNVRKISGVFPANVPESPRFQFSTKTSSFLVAKPDSVGSWNIEVYVQSPSNPNTEIRTNVFDAVVPTYEGVYGFVFSDNNPSIGTNRLICRAYLNPAFKWVFRTRASAPGFETSPVPYTIYIYEEV